LAHTVTLAVDELLIGDDADSDTGNAERLHAVRNIIVQTGRQRLDPMFEIWIRLGCCRSKRLLNIYRANNNGDQHSQKATAGMR
jgi:hypothetical protein